MSIEIVVARIVEANAKRRYYMKQRIRILGALGAHLRSVHGWRKDLPDQERKRIEAAVVKMIETGEAGDDSEMVVNTKSACGPFDKKEAYYLGIMEEQAEDLPVYEDFCRGIAGFGKTSSRGLACIVGECGDFGNYDDYPKIWKRMGLALIGDRRQGNPGPDATKDDWIEHGYKRERRAVMWVIGDLLVKGNRDGPYRTAYLQRKGYEIARAEAAGKTVAPAAKIPKGRTAEFMSEMHVHRRAQRYMEKRLLRDLWRAWRRTPTYAAERLRAGLSAAQSIASRHGEVI